MILVNWIYFFNKLKSLIIISISATVFLIFLTFIMPLQAVTAQEITEEAESDSEAVEALTLYVQLGCSHCKEVESFIYENDLSTEVDIKDMAVDSGAEVEYTEFLDVNEVALEERGVPMIKIGDSDWIFGDQPIIDFLANKYDISIDNSETGSVAGISTVSNEIFLVTGGAVILAVVVGYLISNKKQKQR